ncbi:MAG: ABC transporter ATP-binding protein [Rhodospirillaceae bacterium]|nr:ABC transporter ATP-binding protein [Rhodospirillaceae bacterium]
MASAPPILQLKDVKKSFGSLNAVDGVTLDIVEGELFTIVGPSGSGKTTLIRMLVGMDKPTSGDILLRGKRINDVPANQRPTCMVFQSLALFPHMTVGENVEYSAKCKSIPKKQRKEIGTRYLKLAHMPQSYYDKPVKKCSGGERQRVALARALAFEPEILFFDEPLSAIDYRLRKTLEKELKDIQRETGKTFVYITHSLEEAMVMSDRIGVMRDGKLAQIGSPSTIYTKPQDRFVTEFMGEVNTIPVSLADDGRLVSAELSASFTPPDALPGGFTSGVLIVRPEDMSFVNSANSANGAPENQVEGELFNEYLLGSRIQYQVRSAEMTFLIEELRADAVTRALGDKVTLTWRASDSMVFAE